MHAAPQNLDARVVDGFGDQWSRLDQKDLPEAELRRCFEQYFAIFPWNELPPDAAGMDLGCGSGRWAALVAPRVGRLHCVDASDDALSVARRNLAVLSNCDFHCASVESIPVPDSSLDFAYSLGVLHHVPDTRAALRSCVTKLKPGAPCLLYLYYAFDNRPRWYREVWRASDRVRRIVSRAPHRLRYTASQALAATVYLPLARAAALAERLGADVHHFPLAQYRTMSFYAMRTDALDRFGTRLEQRFTRAEITDMMRSAGLERIRFHDGVPYWCALGYRAR